MSEGVYQEDDASKLAGEVFGGKLSVEEALTRLRTRLLDLSMRNRLLNYRLPKGRSLQFTDNPDLNQVYERLEEGRPVPLGYVPDPPPESYEVGKKPEARHHAKSLGIATSIDLVAPSGTGARQRSPALQVLLYPADLERISRKISSEARTVVEETGTNMLYLIFGFLEYYDSEDSDKAVIAPLLSMPVALNKGPLDKDSRTFIYELAHTGDDVAENFTLREKLKQLRLELPPFEDEETPLDYFKKIEQAISKRRNWKVLNRLTLGFLSFGKLAIWADLDPAKASNLLSSELLRSIFGGSSASPSDAFHAEDYDIDAHEDCELPLIYDADSSQHSALIDVKQGKSLVINGPPGTGKSQTITNIVATALAAGKKVLFVSEKLAALEVVKQRLEKAGLGDFCLELHSHKTQKKQLLESIDRRIKQRYSQPVGYNKRMEVLRERRKELNTYAQLLGSRLGNNLELTVHEVFWATERRRQTLGRNPDGLVGLTINGAAQWSAERVDRCRKTLGDAANALAALGCSPKESPWLGFYPGLLIKGDETAVVDAARTALLHARGMQEAGVALVAQLPGTTWTIKRLLEAEATVTTLQSAESSLAAGLLPSLFPDGLKDLERAKREAARLSHNLSRIRELQRVASAALAVPTGFDVADMSRFGELAETALSERGLSLSPKSVAEHSRKLLAAVEGIRLACAGRAIRIPQAQLRTSQTLRAALQRPEWAMLASVPVNELNERTRAARGVETEVSSALAEVKRVMADGGVPFAGHVDEIDRLLAGGGLHELLPDVQNIGAALEELRRLSATGWGQWTAGQFTSTARGIEESLDAAKQAHEELGAFFNRIGLPVATNRAGLEAIETLLQVAEAAPRELLAMRCPGMERADFSDVAIKAEETYKALAAKASKVEATFHVDSLPADEELMAHIKVFRRGDGLFNFLKPDWRAAKSAFRACTKSTKTLNAAHMAEHFRVVHAFRSSVAAFEADAEFKSAMGALFAGTKTDFGKVRRLHGWVRNSQAALLTTELAQHVNPTQFQEQHIALLTAGAPKVRGWIAKLMDLAKAVKELPGLDPALGKARRVEDLYQPLEDYTKLLGRGAALLSSIARPTVSVQRATQLLDLQRHISEHEMELRASSAAPAKLAGVAGALGLPASGQHYRDLSAGLVALSQRLSVVEEVCELVAQEVSSSAAPREALELLDALIVLEQLSAHTLKQDPAPAQGDLSELLQTRQKQALASEQAARWFAQYAHDSVALSDAIAASRASADAASLLSKTASDRVFCDLLGNALRGTDTDEAAIEGCIAWAQRVSSIADKLPSGTANQLLGSDCIEKSGRVAGLIESACAAFRRYEQAMVGLASYGRIDWVQWGGSPGPDDAVQRLEKAVAGEGVLVAWSKFLAAKNDAASLGVQELIERCEQGKVEAASLVAAFEFVFFRTLSRGILAAHRELARFSGASHEHLRGEFRELDREVIGLTGQKYAAEIDGRKKTIHGVASGRAGDLTEMALLTKEINKQKRHIPIRQLLSRAGKSLQQLKPCFMMGPLSVAQYLEQGLLSFDLIVMDEASQLRPEDALGAVARGKQLVVVGDPKQLPPTSFFDRLMDDDGDDPDEEPSIVEGVESILGICEHLFRPVRTLRWHYRSQHESLIAFSNSQFYDHRLVVFPAPYRRNRRLGVNYRYVKEGIYQDRRNHPEAQRVVDAVVEHMLTCPDESLAVVTLNQTQRELIEDLLDKKLRDVRGTSEFLERHDKAGWPFFVKNLENVQGDERDVIFVSTTFGKPPGSNVVRQGFGPINRADGWRRLNVLFTRARRRIDLFTSMLPEDVRLEERASLGRRALRDYLDFAKTGRLPAVAAGKATEREEDSDFELAVADALKAQDFDTEPQIGVAGYFIDLGVRHPTRRGEFLAGIECDGVTYHSSLSARDRDRIRQEILESLGWRGRIIRVWSTDWFADPAGQTARLVKFLQGRLREDEVAPPPYSDEDLQEHEVQPETEPVELPDPPPVEERLPEPTKIEALVADVQPKVTAQPLLFVELGDRVTYEIASEPPQRHTVQIVDSPSNLKLGLLNDRTPLAQALLGLCEGDEAELRIKDQPARAIRVIRVERQSTVSVA